MNAADADTPAPPHPRRGAEDRRSPGARHAGQDRQRPVAVAEDALSEATRSPPLGTWREGQNNRQPSHAPRSPSRRPAQGSPTLLATVDPARSAEKAAPRSMGSGSAPRARPRRRPRRRTAQPWLREQHVAWLPRVLPTPAPRPRRRSQPLPLQTLARLDCPPSQGPFLVPQAAVAQRPHPGPHSVATARIPYADSQPTQACPPGSPSAAGPVILLIAAEARAPTQQGHGEKGRPRGPKQSQLTRLLGQT